MYNFIVFSLSLFYHLLYSNIPLFLLILIFTHTQHTHKPCQITNAWFSFFSFILTTASLTICCIPLLPQANVLIVGLLSRLVGNIYIVWILCVCYFSCHLLSAFWVVLDVQLPWVVMQLKMLPGVVGICLAAYLLYSNMAVIFTGGVGKNGSSVAVSYILLL